MPDKKITNEEMHSLLDGVLRSPREIPNNFEFSRSRLRDFDSEPRREPTREEHIASAQRMFADIIEKPYLTSIYTFNAIKESLRSAGAGFEVLDPTGVRTAEEIEADFKARERTEALSDARQNMEYISDGRKPNSSFWADEITNLMTNNGLSPLDIMTAAGRTGLTEDQAKIELEGLLRTEFLGAAQSYQEDMNRWAAEGDVAIAEFAAASLAGRALLSAGINADTDGDKKYSIDEINNAIKGIADMPIYAPENAPTEPFEANPEPLNIRTNLAERSNGKIEGRG